MTEQERALSTERMKSAPFRPFTVIMAALLLGCHLSADGWPPVVEPHNDSNASRVRQDQMECQNLARRAGFASTEVAQGAAAGGLTSAASGAMIGAAVGNPGTGTAVGVAGDSGGGTMQGVNGEDLFRRAYIKCMRNRGYDVID